MSDPLALFRDLRDRVLRDQGERAGGGPGLFIAESRHVVRRVVQLGLTVERAVVTPAAAAALRDVLGALPDGVVHVLEPARLEALAGYDVHRGVLAAVRRPPDRTPAEVVRGARLVAVLEDLTDQENLGAIVRSAAALGVDALLLSPRCADPLYRRTVRVSMGESVRLPFARLAPWPDGLGELRDRGWCVVGLSGDGEHTVGALGALAAAPDPANTAPDRIAAGAPRPLALVLGSEADGVSPEARARCEALVRIPMRPGVDSLNVAAAAAIAFHRAADRPAEGGRGSDG